MTQVRSAVVSLLLLGIAIWPAGCSTDQGNPAPITVRNDSGVTIDLVLQSSTTDAEGRLVDDVASGTTAIVASTFAGPECTSSAVVIARDKQGNELARLGGSICPGQLWVVNAPGASPEASR